MIDEAPTPISYARKVASYISDPSTIRVRTLAHFGRAPSIEECRKIRNRAVAEAGQFKAMCETRGSNARDKRHVVEDHFSCGHECSLENTAFKGLREICRECHERRIEALATMAKQRRNLVADMSEPVSPEGTFHGVDLTLNPSSRLFVLITKRTGFSAAQIKSKDRSWPLVRARMVIIWALRTLSPNEWSYPLLAGVVGRADHTTSRHSYMEAVKLGETDAEFAALCNEALELARLPMPRVSEKLVNLFMRGDV